MLTAPSLAIGGSVGSNLFNVTLPVGYDVFDGGPLLSFRGHSFFAVTI
jgi:Ca2+/Na+ antiporter